MDLSVVVPVLNEADGITPLLDRIAVALDGLAFEVIVVDDGSTDGTAAILAARSATDPSLRVITFTRNFGHQAALLAGMRAARGAGVVLMDADGQDPPELLPELVARWRDGVEVVYAVRRRRKASLWHRMAYAAFYRLLRRMAELPIPPDVGDFCLMDRKVVDAVCSLPESTRFIRGLRSWVGFRQEGIEYERPAREHGETSYSFTKLCRLALDGLLSFSVMPLRVASIIGFATSTAGVLYLAYAVISRILVGDVPAGWTSVICVVLLLGGAQLVVTGMLGEYLARVYTETKRRPAYVIRDEG